MLFKIQSFILKANLTSICRFCATANLFNIKNKKKNVEFNARTFVTYFDTNDEALENEIRSNMLVYDDFLSEKEEQTLMEEIEPYMKRLRYEFDHWDNAIHGYRETERGNWNQENSKILNRVKELAFPPDVPKLAYVHILDLDAKGYIKPHIDAVRFCGNTIAGLSLLSSSVMRLVHEENKDKCVDILLKRRSLYIMKNTIRYNYTHEILRREDSKFKGGTIQRERRISVILRNEPSRTDSE